MHQLDNNISDIIDARRNNVDYTESVVNCHGILISCFQPNALVYYILSYSSTCFEPYCAHHQEDLLYIHSIWFCDTLLV